MHISVLTQEVLVYLDPQPGKTYLDVTFGVGGHTRAILSSEPRCRVIALDWDRTALDTYGASLKEEFGDRLVLLWGNFAHLSRILKKAHITVVDGVLADFGLSTVQIRQTAGISFFDDTPLDMRMSAAHRTITAQQLIQEASEKELREIIGTLGEERYAGTIARALVEARRGKKITTTGQLADLIARVVPTKGKIHPATRTFQALRIFVNKELDNIVSFFAALPPFLEKGARVVCISFHSLEDRLVKQFFLTQKQEGKMRILTPKAVTATDEEIMHNRSARSAKLRAAIYEKGY